MREFVHDNHRNIIWVFRYTVIILMALLFLFPFVWMISMSLKDFGTLHTFPPVLIPEEPQWTNYTDIMQMLPIPRWFLNSVIQTFSVTLLQLLTASMAAFAFAALEFKGRDTVFMTFLASLMIPGTVIAIPMYLVVREIGWIDTYTGLIVPVIFTGFGIFLLRQFFLSLPRDYFDAAQVDGCGYFRIFRMIYLPLSVPALATLGTLTFVFTWNSLFWPLIVLSSNDMKTVPLGVTALQGLEFGYPHLVMAGATLLVIPPLIVFVGLQRYFTEGFLLGGGVKG